MKNIREENEKFVSLIANPLLIENQEQAQEVLNWLNQEIANIDAQLDAAAIIAGKRQMRQTEEDWVKRACFALSMKKRDYHKIYQRSKELRGIKGAAQTAGKDTAEGRQLKHQAKLDTSRRLREENETRRLAKQVEYERLKTQQMALAQKKRETELEILRLKSGESNAKETNHAQA